MKLQTIKKEVQTSNNLVSKNFQVKASAKAFKILSSNIYKDKFAAPIRELICNAVDSHIAAKINKPVVVHLPTELEPTFYVQDFGVGLSDKEIKTLYTTYFESNKTDSNDFTGALGLGSKSPFCYTDTFNVVSVKDGKKGTYIAFIDECGMPSITSMGVEKTTEPNGVKVEFAVKDWDYYTFRNRLNEFAFYCNYPLEILNGTKVETIYEKNKDYKHNKHWLNDTNAENQCALIQGNVYYPINFDTLLNDNYFKEQLNQFILEKLNNKSEVDAWQLRSWLKGKVFLAKIGEIDFTASREEISYDKNTCKVITDKILYYFETMKKEFDGIKEKTHSTYEYYVASQEVLAQNYFLSYFLQTNKYQYFHRKVKANEKRLVSYVKLSNEKKFQQYAGSYNYVLLNKDMRVILANSKKELSRVREYFTKNEPYSYVWIFIKDNYTNKDKAILRAIFGGFNGYEKSEEIVYEKAKKERQEKQERYFTFGNYPYMEKGIGLTYDLTCKMSYNSFAYDGVNKYEVEQLMKQFLRKDEKVKVCTPKTKDYDESKDLLNILKQRKEEYKKQNQNKIIAYGKYRAYCDTMTFELREFLIQYLPELKNIAKAGLSYEERLKLSRAETSLLEELSDDSAKETCEEIKTILSKYPMLKIIETYRSGWKEILKEYIELVDKNTEKVVK